MSVPFGIIDEHRETVGFRPLADVIQLAHAGVRILDPWSFLVSPGVTLDPDVTVFPNVVLHCDSSSTVRIGPGTLLYPGTIVQAFSASSVRIGSRCEIGPGGAQVKANAPGTTIVIGDEARLLNGCELVGNSVLGDGCQLIGQISAQSVRLAGGKGYRWPEPGERGALLKGAGLAREITLRTGQVMNLQPSFADSQAESQSSYHPKAK